MAHGPSVSSACGIFPRMWDFPDQRLLRVVKLAKTESRPVVARGWRDERVLFTGFRVSVLEDSASTGDRW